MTKAAIAKRTKARGDEMLEAPEMLDGVVDVAAAEEVVEVPDVELVLLADAVFVTCDSSHTERMYLQVFDADDDELLPVEVEDVVEPVAEELDVEEELSDEDEVVEAEVEAELELEEALEVEEAEDEDEAAPEMGNWTL